MRFFSFIQDGREGLGLRLGERLVDVGALDPALPASMAALLAGGMDRLPAIRDLAERSDPAADLTPGSFVLRPPVPSPGKILCIGTNYQSFAQQLGREVDKPFAFVRTATSLVADRGEILVPATSSKLDYEIELAAVVGRRLSAASPEEAREAVAGYAVFNDVTVRDFQGEEPLHVFSKNFDATGPFGPDLVTADELPPGGRGLRLRTWVNDRLLQDGNTDDMIFDVGQILSYLSHRLTLEPGDVITTGTPPGVGSTLAPQVWLKPRDRCVMTINGVGTLTNTVAAAPR
jgi:2-keto-4-pentenoate hydratase/2-oxohepta-3-ene-1,7-dioic acid hydratase in catechol pathway